MFQNGGIFWPGPCSRFLPSLHRYFLIVKESRFHLHGYRIVLCQPGGQTVHFRQFIAEKVPAGKNFALVKIGIRDRGVGIQCPAGGYRLMQPLPGNGDNPEQFQKKGSVGQKHFGPFFAGHPKKVESNFLQLLLRPWGRSRVYPRAA